MSNEAITAVSKADIRPSGRKFVLMALADYADEAWSCFPSVTQLAAYTSQGEKTVRDHLDALEQDGLIERTRHRRDDGTLGRYRFVIQRRISPPADFARGEKPPKPPADFAAHNPQLEPSISPSQRASDFDRFWSSYPHKVGKRHAEKAFASALKRTPLEALMDGLARYASKTDDRPWCNPATWLNQDRWADAPAIVPQSRGSPVRHDSVPTMSDMLAVIAERPRDDRQTEQDRNSARPRVSYRPATGSG